jgi:hypothetical protein
MSAGHYYHQETGNSIYQRKQKEEVKPTLFCGFDIKSWFYSSKSVDNSGESLHFNDSYAKEYNTENAQEAAVHMDQDYDNSAVTVQESKAVNWSIAKTVLLLCIIGSMMGLLFANSDYSSSSNSGSDINEFASTLTNTTRF